MNVRYYALSDIGKVRKVNEDSYFVNLLSNGYYLAMVADGMGGHNAGDVASRETVRQLSYLLNEGRFKEGALKKELPHIVSLVNQRVFEMGQTNPQMSGMGTTLTLMMIKEKAHIVQVGDSRLYHLDNGQLVQITEDQTFVNELVKSGIISKERAFNHPDRNKLTSALGTSFILDQNFYHLDKVEGTYLICSDGLYNEVTERDLAIILESELPIKEKANKIMNCALSHQAMDNITFIILEVTK